MKHPARFLIAFGVLLHLVAFAVYTWMITRPVKLVLLEFVGLAFNGLIGGALPLINENHKHTHIHTAMIHEHSHSDEESTHAHDDIKEVHSHEHEHPVEEHEHDHMPDIHHRHGHEE